MTNLEEFIKNELRKRGYPLENYVQSLLVERKWDVQPNAYFLDKDTGKGRELDIRAYHETEALKRSYRWSRFLINLLIQCKKIVGNAWIFFSSTDSFALMHKYSLSDFLKLPPAIDYGIYDRNGTHFDKREMVATNYCEVIIDEEKSNKRLDNIWECVVTLIKATSEHMENECADTKKFFEEECDSYDEFASDPTELVKIFYPLIVFEGRMYQATFVNDSITLKKADHVELLVDYRSRNYEGTFCIEVVTRARLPEYLEDIVSDLAILGERRISVTKEYETFLLEQLRRYYLSKSQSALSSGKIL